MQERLERRFSALGGEQRPWLDFLEDTVDAYNNTVHSSIGMKPIDVTPENEDAVFKKYLSKFKNKKRKKPKFSVGDLVRLPIKTSKKNSFRKSSRAKWTEKIYKIVKIYRGHKVPMYSVVDEKGKRRLKRYYERQLNLVMSFKNR